jgi:hypothetical protein
MAMIFTNFATPKVAANRELFLFNKLASGGYHS